MKTNLQSSVQDLGEVVTQYVLFNSGNEKTYKGIITSTIEQSQFTRFDCVDGKRVYLNTKNIDCFEVFKNNG